MTQFISLTSLFAILIYAIAQALCFMMYGKNGKKLFQYAGAAMFVAILGSVGNAAQNLIGLTSAHTLVLASILAFNIVEIYLFAKVIHAIFRKNLSAAFYIWLCVVIMINGFISPFPVDVSLWIFIAFNISIIVLCIFYWESLVRETDEDRHQEAAKYSRIILALAVCAIAVLAYSVTNLSLFQKIPSRNIMNTYYVIFGLLVACWLIGFCQHEYEADTACPMKHTFRALLDGSGESPLLVSGFSEEAAATTTESPDQMEQFCTQYDLTERETEILQLILAGKSNQEISDDLFITVGTVKAHVHSIFSKLNVSRRSQLMTLFMEHEPNNK